MNTALGQFGLQTASQLIGGAMGMFMGNYNDERQLKQQEALQAQQIRGQKEMMDYSYQKQMNMWEDTNYRAQVEQLKKAGLNPGLIYGMKGGGGVTTGTPTGNVSGGQAPSGGREIQDMIGLGMQGAMNLKLMDAQAKQLESQTNLNNTQAGKIGGIDTKEAEARTENLWQGLENLKEDWNIKRLQQTMMNIENWEKQATQEDRIDYITYQSMIAAKQLNILNNENKISDETLLDKIKIVQQTAIGAVIENELKKQNISTQKSQINKWATEIQQGWQHLDQEKQKIALANFEAEVKANFPNIGQSIGRIVNDGVESIMNATKGNRDIKYRTPANR